MALKQRSAYIAIGGLLTLACYAFITLGVGVLNPQYASAQESNIPTEDEIMADLIGRRIKSRSSEWYDICSMRNFESFEIVKTDKHAFITEYSINMELDDLSGRYVMLHVCYRKTDTGWKLVSVQKALYDREKDRPIFLRND